MHNTVEQELGKTFSHNGNQSEKTSVQLVAREIFRK